jgi:Tfp pilus assembly pilus retraction ATPase PilT
VLKKKHKKMKISRKLLKQIILEELQKEMCGCQEDHGEILVAYDVSGKEVMRSNAFKEGSEEALQLQKLVPVLQAQDLQVKIIPAPHDHPMAVSVDDPPQIKVY